MGGAVLKVEREAEVVKTAMAEAEAARGHTWR